MDRGFLFQLNMLRWLSVVLLEKSIKACAFVRYDECHVLVYIHSFIESGLLMWFHWLQTMRVLSPYTEIFSEVVMTSKSAKRMGTFTSLMSSDKDICTRREYKHTFDRGGDIHWPVVTAGTCSLKLLLNSMTLILRSNQWAWKGLCNLHSVRVDQ